MVGRVVGVEVGTGVSVTRGVPVGGVVVGASVFNANRSGVNVAGRLNGVAVGCGGWVGEGGPRNGIESSGRAVHPASREMSVVMRTSRFMSNLSILFTSLRSCKITTSRYARRVLRSQ
jgi:hypothetical protein